MICPLFTLASRASPGPSPSFRRMGPGRTTCPLLETRVCMVRISYRGRPLGDKTPVESPGIASAQARCPAAPCCHGRGCSIHPRLENHRGKPRRMKTDLCKDSAYRNRACPCVDRLQSIQPSGHDRKRPRAICRRAVQQRRLLAPRTGELWKYSQCQCSDESPTWRDALSKGQSDEARPDLGGGIAPVKG